MHSCWSDRPAEVDHRTRTGTTNHRATVCRDQREPTFYRPILASVFGTMAVMAGRTEALELDSVVVPIDEREPLVPVDTWLAALRALEPLHVEVSAAELLAQVRQDE